MECSPPAPALAVSRMSAPSAKYTSYVTVEYTGPKPSKTCRVEIWDTAPLRMLKDGISVGMHIPLGSYKIMSQGKQVTASDVTTLYECLTFKDGGYTVRVTGNPDPSGGVPSHVYERALFVKLVYDGRRHSRTDIRIPVIHTTRLQDLKERIATTLEIPTKFFKLVSDGKHVTSDGKHVTASGETLLYECLECRDNEYSVRAIDFDPKADYELARGRALVEIQVAEGRLRSAVVALERLDSEYRGT